MNSFADIKDQLVEQFQSLWLKIQESDAFISLKEKFENLPQTYQTLIKVFFAVFFAWFVYSIPAGYMAESEENEELFNEHREMTRDIIKAGRLARSIQMPPPAKMGPALKMLVNTKIRGQRILPNQVKPLSDQSSIAGKKLISKKIKQNGVVAKLTGINLQQMVNVAQDIDDIQGVRLINLVLQADNKDDHVFNVDYELASFSIPIDDDPIEKSGKKGKKKKNKKGKKKR